MKPLLSLFILGILITSQSFAISFVGISPDEDYNPQISPNDFTTKIEGNAYFHLPVGSVLKFEEKTADGVQIVKIQILDETVNVNGIETRVYWDRVYLDDTLVEDTRDYIAQHKQTGDVWYFGEDVNNYEDGKLVDHEGAWLYGKGEALPGIWVKAKPKVGEIYRQEYLEGEAEDIVKVVSLSAAPKVGNKTYSNCLQTYDFTPLDANSKEHKYYCPEVGNLVLTKHLVDNESANLVSAEKPENLTIFKENNDEDKDQEDQDADKLDENTEHEDEEEDHDKDLEDEDEDEGKLEAVLFGIIAGIGGLIVGAIGWMLGRRKN